MASPIDDLPPKTGPELQSMRLDSLERRLAMLEAQLLLAQFRGDSWESTILQHRLESIDWFAAAGLITREKAAERKAAIERDAQKETS